MAIQKKSAKGRLDKWYRKAKEKGYRARAAFKLIQLNQKYSFLEKSKVLLDLCAAPGSWCQVAAEVMPKQGSLIIGVDLAPIKPIHGAITFSGDITTDKCRATIRQYLKTSKADTVLHDGAPNVGIAWVQDAYSQAELVLQSLKLATEFLVRGGTFVTKVFRSKDYNALLWVFKQLFDHVEATKPPSSRNVSAEIFVICQRFKAPKRIDPKLLDSRHVFAELQEPTPNNEAKVFNPEKKKRKREGYVEGDYTQHKTISISDFIHSTDPIAILANVNRLSLEQSPNGDLALATLDRLPETTDDIRAWCADLKVLGKKEFRTLLRWRLKVRNKFGMTPKKNKDVVAEISENDEVAEVESMDEEHKIQGELQRLRDIDISRKKKERRKENERRQKGIVRMQMHMTTPQDIGLEQIGPNGEGAIFNVKTVEKAQNPARITKRQMEDVEDEGSDTSDHSAIDTATDDEADLLDRELDVLYESYQQRKEDRDAKERAKRARKQRDTDEFGGFSGSEAERADSTTEEESDYKSPFPSRRLSGSMGLSAKAKIFFDQDIFQGLGMVALNDEDSAIDLGDESDENAGVEHKQRIKQVRRVALPGKGNLGSRHKEDPQNPTPEAVASLIRTGTGEMLETEGEAAWQNRPAKPVNAPSNKLADDPRKKNGQLDIEIITAEAMTLAQSIATGEKTSQDVIDDGFNKYSFRDTDGLPEWFLNDEGKHSKPHRPVTAAAAAAIREKLRALNARPIKKVREAKSRKKFKAAQRLEKLRKKSALLADDEAMSEKDKASTIAKMMSKAAKKKPKQSVKIVVAKGGNKGISGRPRGIKGKYKIVDARLKKDVRAEKRLAKKQK